MGINMTSDTWVVIDGNCPIACEMHGSDFASLLIGRDDITLQLDLNAASLREIATVAAEVVAQMDAVAKQEEAEQVDDDGSEASQHCGPQLPAEAEGGEQVA